MDLLGTLLGQLIVEQEGDAFPAQVERARCAATEVRRDGDEWPLRDELDAIELSVVERLVRAFSLCSHLTTSRRRSTGSAACDTWAAAPGGVVDGSIVAALRACVASSGASRSWLTHWPSVWC